MAETGGDPTELLRVISDLFANDPVSGLILVALLGMGALITGASVAAFGYLSAGGVLSALGDLVPSGRSPPRQQ